MLRHFVGVEARDILDQRGFERCTIIARRHHRTRQRCNLALLFLHFLGGEIASPPGHDLKAVRVRANKQRLQDAARSDARQDVRNVGRSLGVAHVERRDVQPVDVDMLELHRTFPCHKVTGVASAQLPERAPGALSAGFPRQAESRLGEPALDRPSSLCRPRAH